jgi:hypothetical protein
VFIPGEVVAAVTFPGVIVHEAAHQIFCRLRGVAVLDVCYFRFGNPAGYVIHEPVENFTTAFFISVGPFIVNSLLCMILCFPAFVPVRIFDVSDPLSYVLMYFGISIGMHAFPSTTDAQNLLHHAKLAAKRFHPLAILSFPLVVLIYIANILSVVWADAIYGFAIGLGLPELIFKNVF